MGIMLSATLINGPEKQIIHGKGSEYVGVEKAAVENAGAK